MLPHYCDAVSSGFFVLRTPLLPFDEFANWSAPLDVFINYRASSVDALEAWWQANVIVLRDKLRSTINRPEIRRAIFLASPELEQSIENWLHHPESKKGLQTERSLVRYFGRMSGRATPLGLLSGCSLGNVDQSEELIELGVTLESRKEYRTRSSLTFDYLFELATTLQTLPDIAMHLRYFPNPTLYRLSDGTIRYLEVRKTGSHWAQRLVSLQTNEYLKAVVDSAGRSAKTISELAHELQDGEYQVPSEDASRFVADLVESSVLESSLLPLLTGKTALDDLIEQLALIPAGRKFSTVLSDVRQLLRLQDQTSSTSVSDYEQILSLLTSLPYKPETSRPFSVDLYKPLQTVGIPSSLCNELLTAVDFLAKTDDRPAELDSLKTFKEQFIGRYGEGRWIPLSEALDPDFGVGFRVDRHKMPCSDYGVLEQDVSNGNCLTSLHLLLLDKLVGKQSPSEEVVLSFSDIASVSDRHTSSPPDAFSLVISLSRSCQDTGNTQGKICLLGASGPSGASLLGRFCRLDPLIEQQLRAHIHQEEMLADPDTVYAEIVHLPAHPRSGNLLSRPLLRAYEIPYGGRSGCGPERLLTAADLLVTVTDDAKIILFSRRLGKKVIPRLSSALAFNQPTSPTIYNFLTSLQHANNTKVPVFSWGPLATLPFLPRVRHGNVVLSKARWRLTKDEALTLTEKSRWEAFVATQMLRDLRHLPRWIQFGEGDSLLTVDLDNPLSVDTLIHLLKRDNGGTIREMYPGPDDLFVRGPEGTFVSEMVLPFVRQLSNPPATAGPAVRDILTHSVETSLAAKKHRTFAPGSEWLYLKAYGSKVSLDDFLATRQQVFLHDIAAAGFAIKWFFVRYSDPEHHLRIRFKLTPNVGDLALLNIVTDLCQELLEQGSFWKVELATYEREIERYGGLDGMVACEDIFCSDSDAVSSILSVLEANKDLALRVRLSVVGVNGLFNDCGLTLLERSAAVRRARLSMQKRFGAHLSLPRASLNRRFREERRELEASIKASTADQSGFHADSQEFFHRRSLESRAAFARLWELARTGRLTRAISEIALDLAHLHINRMIYDQTRRVEFMVYDFLSRLYESDLARSLS